ncbi:Putative Benzaldehyde lyase [Penicillium brasilianum]|uniref:Putative Benzaldehyde lyase n=1 Tax=Penicillium brasilianum TaxID=104259 RepID=A0A0F7TIS1_PENBI|nr:Putative Benzaldehyde lyase [Penicillium brasilianum]
MVGFPLQHPKTRELTGGDLLAQSLKTLGVEVAFGLHGGHLDAFLMGCEDIGIRLVDTRHETVAVQAAEGYCRISTKPGVCFVTANSGFSNGLPGLATAYADRSPILCITSSPPLRDTENNSLQGSIDQVVAARPITKFAHRLVTPEECPRIVSHALRVAQSGPPGPVLLDFPIDVLFSPIHTSLISWGSINSPPSFPPAPHTAAVEAAVKLLGAAQRPVIITGTGARGQQARRQLFKLAEDCSIPVFNTSKYASFTPSSPMLSQATAGTLATLPSVNLARPDLVVLLGARTGMFLGGRSGAIIPDKECKLIQVDCDGSEIGRSLPVDLGIVSDVEAFISAVNAALASTDATINDQSWVQSILGLASMESPYEREPQVTASGRLHPYHAVKNLVSGIEPGSIIVLDGGEASAWVGDLASRCQPHTVMTATGYLGFLGNGFGYTLGCAIAAPDRKIVNIQGDGSAGFHLMELDTYKRFGLNIMTVVVNNSSWGMSSNGQDLVYGTDHPARPISALSSATEYDVVATGLQVAAAKISRIADIQSTVTKFQEQSGPSCINLIVDRKPVHPITTAMIGLTDDPNLVVVPYYDNIPRTFYRL